LLLAYRLRRAANGAGNWLAAQMLLFSIVYPCVAGLDSPRQDLYLNLCALVFLSATARLLLKRLAQPGPQLPPTVVASPVNS
jgi:hypothetical protein